MDIFTRAIKNTIKGEWRINLSSEEVIYLINPTLEETLHIEQESAIAYNKFANNGVPTFAQVAQIIKDECESLSIDYSILENKYKILKKLLESKEYHNLLATINDMTVKSFKLKLSEMLTKYVDADKLINLQKAEAIYEKHYRHTAEYFSYFAKMKMLIFYSVHKEDKSKYFLSPLDIGKCEPDFLEEIIFYVKENLIPTGKESFFLL